MTLSLSQMPIADRVFAGQRLYTSIQIECKTSGRRTVGTCVGPDIIVNGLCPIAATSVVPLFQLSFLLGGSVF